jgi:hypothetical protein
MSNRASVRALKRLMLKNERVLEADSRFFHRHRDRTHRLRLASTHEVQMHAAAGGTRHSLETDERLFCIVKNAGHFRLRAFFPGPASKAGCTDDLSDEQAAWIYSLVEAARPQVSEIERQMADAFPAGGGAS